MPLLEYVLENQQEAKNAIIFCEFDKNIINCNLTNPILASVVYANVLLIYFFIITIISL